MARMYMHHGAHQQFSQSQPHQSWCACVSGTHTPESWRTCDRVTARMLTNHGTHPTRHVAHLIVTIILPTHTPRNSSASMYILVHISNTHGGEGIRHMSTNSDARRLVSWRTCLCVVPCNSTSHGVHKLVMISTYMSHGAGILWLSHMKASYVKTQSLCSSQRD